MRKIALILILTILAVAFAGCKKPSDDVDETTSAQTTGTTTTTGTTQGQATYDPEELERFLPEELSKHPIYDMNDDEFDIIAEYGRVRIIGEGDSFYIDQNGKYFLAADIDTPVTQYGNAFEYDADGDGETEIFIYDFEGSRTVILVYDVNTKLYYGFDIPGLVYIYDYPADQGFRLYTEQREEYPFSLNIYSLKAGKLFRTDVSKATGNEYSVLTESKYIFAGSPGALSMHKYKNGVFEAMDPTLYLTARSMIQNIDTRLISFDDLKLIPRYMLQFVLNEIYARHGFVFEDEYLAYYFTNFPWYIPDPGFRKDMVNKNAMSNIGLIEAYMEQLAANIRVYEEMEADEDLDGDGVKEKVSLSINGDKYILSVGGISAEGTGDTLLERLHILDIDSSDKYLEIAVSEAGPSDDYATYIYRYDGESLDFMGRVEGDAESFSLAGDGRLVTYRRGNTLHTWFYMYTFKIDATGMLTGIDEPEYLANTFVMLLRDLDVYDSPEGGQVGFVIRAGEPALIVSGDDESFFRIRNNAGQEGFFRVSGFYEINGTGITADVYFDGLSFAD